ncbi:MAG TPA: flagellar basal body L-ring protein FlgH [Terriglobia bacterium]|nr:flagellar basal body L-ring protein FlgH [Terriglobia bacterium]
MKRTAICALLGVVVSMPAIGQNNQNNQNNASLYSDAAPNLFLFRDLRARNVNDIVTIVIVENSTASNTANTSTQKKGDVAAAVPAFLGIKTLQNPLSLNSALDFSGQGSTTRSGQLNASLSARIVQVLPNGDLVIEGTKQVTINREHQLLTVRGTVRQYDLTPTNVVSSNAIANMEVNFDGKGIISDANKPALLFKIFKYILPF